MDFCKFNIEPVSIQIAKTTYKLRAKYSFLKTPDALQLASAIHNNCSIFFTNDNKIKNISEIEVTLVTDL
ncbi:MAG: PIN domain-containing protein [Bacteroidales bacterium]|nr:PIN domain-containing protein [Bacteroidales bacterium]